MFTDKYGTQWNSKPDDLQVEFQQIRLKYFLPDKSQLVPHFLSVHKLIWPHDDQHRWFKLGIKNFCEKKINVFLGAASTNKTYLFVVCSLIIFWVFPKTSLSIISTTDIISLERKVWGRIKKMFNRGRARYGWLEGFILDSKRQITPDDIDDDNEVARSLEYGIGTVACVSGGKFVGMGKFQGSKPPHSEGKTDGILIHFGDEAAVMQPSFLDAYSNWMVSDGFKGVMGGNPTDITDPLCTAAEPVQGWDSFIDTGKTQEWDSKWYNAHVTCFDGRDTPNNDEPKNSYPYLIKKEFIELLRSTYGNDSWQIYQQGYGKPSRGMVSNRVITMGLCERNKAFEDVVWRGGSRTRLYAIDPAYGGGDRCVGTPMQFGEDVNGKQIIDIGEPEIIPVRLSNDSQVGEAEEQIAEYTFRRLKELDIKPEHCFYDSFGRGTLGNAFAKLFGSNCPIPVDSGQKATERPVRFDLFVGERENKRLKKCNEHYSKFVTEMWFSTREAIESQQVRNLQRTIAQEGQLRMYKIVTGNRIEVESKDDMKDRIKKSPDLYDCFAIGVEGARRLGFKIQRIGIELAKKKPLDWLDKFVNEREELRASKRLQTVS